MSNIKLSVITPFKGDPKDLFNFLEIHKNLITNEQLSFIIVDGSYEKTFLKDHFVRYFHKPTFGLYAALNFGILSSKSKFYLTLGVDDILNEKIFLALNKLSKDTAIASFPVKNCDFLLKSSFLRINHRQYVYQHSCSSIINKDIHSEIGLYPTDLKIASDAFIILKAKKMGFKIFTFENILIGIYGIKGISSKKVLKANFEMFLISIKLDHKLSSLYYLFSLFIKIFFKCLKF